MDPIGFDESLDILRAEPSSLRTTCRFCVAVYSRNIGSNRGRLRRTGSCYGSRTTRHSVIGFNTRATRSHSSAIGICSGVTRSTVRHFRQSPPSSLRCNSKLKPLGCFSLPGCIVDQQVHQASAVTRRTLVPSP